MHPMKTGVFFILKKMEKTGKEWFEKLSEIEQKQFKENLTGVFFNTYMKKKKSDFCNFIAGCFDWSETPKDQGFDYWHNIAIRKIMNNKKYGSNK